MCDVICNDAVPFRPYCTGVATWTRNVSEYMLVLALCLVFISHSSHCNIQHILTAVPRLTQPSTLRGMTKWVSAFRLTNNNKWVCCMWTIAATKQTNSPGRLASFEAERPSGVLFCIQQITSWTLVMTTVWWQHTDTTLTLPLLWLLSLTDNIKRAQWLLIGALWHWLFYLVPNQLKGDMQRFFTKLMKK